MKRFRFCAIFLLTALLMSLFAPVAAALSDPQADSSHAVVLVAERGDSETVLYTKNETERLMPASLTKVMTVLLALEAVEDGTKKLSDMVTASDRLYYDISGDSSSVYMAIGETMTLENLLYCAMLNSANEACNVIAEYIGGTIENFIEMMNARAAALGCKDTHFTNTHGMPDPDHYTTAWDFSRILREAARSDVFMEIANTVTYVVPDTNASAERKLENTNSLINPTNPLYPGDYGYEYARGVKTGHTSDAGYCLATTAEKDGVQLLAVIMKADAYQLDDGTWYYGHFADAKTLFNWAFDNFSYQEIVKSTEIVAEVGVEMGADAETVAVRPSTSITALLPNDISADAFERKVTIYRTDNGDGTTLMAPVSAGQTVGEISVSLNGETYGTSPLVTSTSVDLSRVSFMKGELMETLRRPAVVLTFWGLVLLLALYITLVVRYRLKRRAYQRRLANARQLRLDLEEDDEPAPKSRPRKKKPEMVMEPESYREKSAASVDEPTRVSGKLPDLADAADEPTRADLPKVTGEDEKIRDYFEEFFNKK